MKNNNNITSPHDRYFRSMMSDSKIAKKFFERHLPQKIKETVNFSTIEPQKDSFVQDNLKQQMVDLLFSAEFNGKDGYIYLLLEHQSTPDALMPFRILKYMIAIMEQHMKKSNKRRLPIIYPMIFYSGHKPYRYSTDIFDLFEGDKDLAKDILWRPYKLIDLSKISDDKLKEDVLYSFFMRTMQYAHEKNIKILTKYLRELIEKSKFIENIGGTEYFRAIINYIFKAFNISKEEFSDVVKESLQFVEEKRNMATLAEQFRQEGFEKGKALKEQKIIIKLLNQGMSASQIAEIVDVSINKVESLNLKERSQN